MLLDGVDGKTLSCQIADELRRRDDAPEAGEEDDDAPARAGFSYLERELVDCLSEENLGDVSLDRWLAIYREANAARERKQQQEKTLVREFTVNRGEDFVPYTEIKVSLGVPWISAEIISDFAEQVLKAEKRYRYEYDKALKMSIPVEAIPLVRHEKITGSWYVDKYRVTSAPEMVQLYGISRFDALHVLESALNIRPIRLYDGKEYNVQASLAAQEKREALEAAFEEWVWQDEDRIWEIEEAYNRMFGEYKPVAFDGSKLKFPGMNPAISLFPYQRNAVQKIISTPNTLLSFDVGSGKTYIMIAAAMSMRKSGLSPKNMFVVPNNIVGQWEKMFTDLYPDAKVLAVEPRSFKPEKRHKVMEQIQQGDYDGIIVAYSCFELMPLSGSCLLEDMHRTMTDLERNMQRIASAGFTGGATAIARERDYVQKSMQQLMTGVCGIQGSITFDMLGINTLFVDEAHNFKNLPIQTKMKNLRGINTTGSAKCFEMLKKVHFVQEQNGGRGAVFATGTPLCNSISDAYAMQRYLQEDELKKHSLDRFDNWIKTFARAEMVCEIDVDTSGFRMVERFREFFNLRELSRMFGQISVYHAMNQQDLPSFSGYSDDTIPKGPALAAYMRSLYHRSKVVRARDISPKKDNMLKISTDGRKAALSLNLVGKEQSWDKYSKVFHCVENVADIYRRFDGCSQLVFCDYATPQNSCYSVYQEMKERLQEKGIPEQEIAFIHSCRNE